MSLPKVEGALASPSAYRAGDFVEHLRDGGWDPGPIPESVIFTYGGFDLLCSAQPELFSMNPMLGPGPGRFFLVSAAQGRVGVCCMGIGAPAVVAQLEILTSLGVRRFLSLGTAGGLGPDQAPGEVVVVSGAIRDEGTSHHYAGSDIEALPDTKLTDALAEALRRAGIVAQPGFTWTTDAPYRQTVAEIAEFRRRNVRAVEMEAAALFVAARALGVVVASAVVLDCVFGEPIGPPPMDGASAFGTLYDVFVTGIDLLERIPTML